MPSGSPVVDSDSGTLRPTSSSPSSDPFDPGGPAPSQSPSRSRVPIPADTFPPSTSPTASPTTDDPTCVATDDSPNCPANKPVCCKRDNGNGNGDVDKCTNANSAVNSCKEGIASANTCEFLPPSLAEALKPPDQQQNGSACTGSNICCVQIARPETSGKGITFGECLSEDQFDDCNDTLSES